MKPFESPIGPLFEDYIAYRAGLGYGEKQLRRILLGFDRYVQEQGAGLTNLTPVFFLGLKARHNKRRSSFNALLLAVRGFFAYLKRRQIVAENPLSDIESYPPNAYIPFVFSPQQTDALLFAAQKNIRKKDPDSFFRDYCAYLAIVLLARCGMRISEPLRLTLPDYRPSEKTLYIQKTKFHKDRLIPIPEAAAGRAIHVKNVYRLFDQSVTQIGLNRKKHIIANTSFARPTPHSLRHSFAINTLSAVRQRGGCPQNALPVLSCYLGHVKYRYTAVYLKVLDAKHRNALVDFSIRRQEEI